LEAPEECLGIISYDGYFVSAFELEPKQVCGGLKYNVVDFKLLWCINFTFLFAAEFVALTTRFKKLN
jgi:hypothetical protein